MYRGTETDSRYYIRDALSERRAGQQPWAQYLSQSIAQRGESAVPGIKGKTLTEMTILSC